MQFVYMKGKRTDAIFIVRQMQRSLELKERSSVLVSGFGKSF